MELVIRAKEVSKRQVWQFTSMVHRDEMRQDRDWAQYIHTMDVSSAVHQAIGGPGEATMRR